MNLTAEVNQMRRDHDETELSGADVNFCESWEARIMS